MPLLVKGALSEEIGRNGELVQRLARISEISATDDVPKGAVQVVVDEVTYILPLADVVDFAAEKTRLEKVIAKLDDEQSKIVKKLSNKGFLEKAPEKVVAEQRERQEKITQDLVKQKEALDRLASF